MTDLNTLSKQVLTDQGYKSITLGSNQYSVKLLPAYPCLQLALEIIKLISPMIGSFLDGKQGGDDSLVDFQDSSLYTEIGILLSEQLSKVDIVSLSSSLLEGTLVNNAPLNVDVDLVGGKGLAVLYKLIEFSLKENIGDFLLELLRERGLEIHSWEDLKGLMAQTPSE